MIKYENGVLTINETLDVNLASNAVSSLLYQGTIQMPWEDAWKFNEDVHMNWMHNHDRAHTVLPMNVITDILYKGTAAEIRYLFNIFLKRVRSDDRIFRPVTGFIWGDLHGNLYFSKSVKDLFKILPDKRVDKIWKAIMTYGNKYTLAVVNALPITYLPLALSLAQKKEAESRRYQQDRYKDIITAITSRLKEE